MAISPRSTALATALLVVAAAAICAAAARLPPPSATNDTSLSHYFYVESCPQLETIVRSAVDNAIRLDVRLTAGLLRIFFHDCFPQGCDASILLDNGERLLAPNVGLQQGALQLIEDIRAKVHAACGPTVSCADILVLATRDAVNLAGGPAFTVPLGRLDSRAPASDSDVFALPPPTSSVDELLGAFNSRNLSDPADLVALSGAHTVGKARCNSFTDRTNPPKDDISRCLSEFCSSGDGNRLRDLDFLTPEVFDNMYYIDLMLNKGVMLTSDQGLASDGRTSWLVKGFADNHWWFFDQFSTSMIKMSKLKGPQGNVGEIRGNCFRPNSPGTAIDAGAGGEGLAASA
ncbi:cationic peroxidase SPC4-like [Phragmites australis]|uniref:cationic peroxidase SPC4-like n=1 Tax=Phragmites australis TaxID=29695 RepID=UPI002D79D3E5|nr:cationic peroxidase SPC4-like [Phragmites australis]